MLKITPLAIALLTVIAIIPEAQALTPTARPASIHQPAGDLHAQLIIKIGVNSDSHSHSRYEEIERRRLWKLQRAKEVAAARLRRYKYYSNRNNRDNYNNHDSYDNYDSYDNNDNHDNSSNEYRIYRR
jgi:hypothetical protein